jgi:hypothetical protein
MTDGARDDVEHDREREPETQQPAQHHQDQLEPVERPPFQVMLPLQHQFVGDGHPQALPAFVVPANAGTHNHRRQ